MDLLQRPASEVPSVSEVSLGEGGCASISKRAPFISAVMHGAYPRGDHFMCN